VFHWHNAFLGKVKSYQLLPMLKSSAWFGLRENAYEAKNDSIIRTPMLFPGPDMG
jgi:hypothetical protein